MIDRLLARDSEIDMRIERDMCFFRRLQHRDTATSFFNTHTHSLTPTLTHTPTHDGPTVADRSSGSRGVFFRVLQNILDQKRVRKSFFDRQGVTQHPKIISRVLKIFSFVYVCFCMQALCCRNLRLC